MSRETVQEMKALQMTRVLKLQKMEKVIHHMTTETQMIQMDNGDYTEDNSDYQGV